MASMAAGSAISIKVGEQCAAASRNLSFNRIGGLRALSFSVQRKTFPSLRLQPARFQVSCAAKPETVDKVIGIVKKQLALPDETSVTSESKFSALGADSLDTVEIVMGIEEAFGVSVEEESAQNIVTVQDVADMVEKLLGSNSD